MNYNHLLYCRQFLLSSIPCAKLAQWQYVSFSSFHLYVHPYASVSHEISEKNLNIILIGYIVDPNNVEKTNSDVLKIISGYSDSIEKVCEYLNLVSGRFVLIINTPKDTLIFNDACGLKTVYYTNFEGQTFAASQPLLFNQVIPLKYGDRHLTYESSSYVSQNKEHWIPSGCSLFEEVHQLVPNHYLSLATFKQIRYWPKRVLSINNNVDEVVDEALDILKNLVYASSLRFNLALPLTAGLDSRILLSTSKDISSELFFYTLQYRDLNSGSSDLKIPAKLLCELGLEHNIIDCRTTVPENFYKLYLNNSSPAHMDDWGYITYGMMVGGYPGDRVCMRGNCAEIARCFYYKYGLHTPIESSDQILKIVSGWNTIPFICDQIYAWYNSVSELTEECNIDILDLFYWEHRMGSWQAQSQLELDIVQETFTPFNNRKLLELLLSTSAKYRCAPDYTLFKMIMQRQWPEVLKQPINPPTLKKRLKNIMIRSGILKM